MSEFVYFRNDSIWIRIYNNDAFGTYLIGRGKYFFNRSRFIPDDILSASIEPITRNDSLITIKVLESDRSPMRYVSVRIYEKKSNKSYFESNTNDKGLVIFNRDESSFLDKKEVVIWVETIGFMTKMETNIKKGYDYIIKSSISQDFPFTIIDKSSNLRITKCGDKEIVVKYGREVKTVLQKMDIDFNYNRNISWDSTPHPAKTNNEEMLSTQEAELLNSLLENSRGTFDFEGKKVAFITGSSGSRILPKTDFLTTCVNPWLEKNEKPQIFMILLNEKEKSKSGGYEVLVLSWVKVITNRQKCRIIERLSALRSFE